LATPTPHKVISASAGSGKTYRLALEYIAIIAENIYNPEFHFSRILVITFTRKATAEIRNKIFSLLASITEQHDATLIRQIEQKVGFELSEKIINDLRQYVYQLRIEKDKVRISTIDSLINQIFKTMIAPMMKLSNYSVEENANLDVWQSIFEQMSNDGITQTLRELTEINPQKRIDSLGAMMLRLINDRWILHLIQESGRLYKSAYTHEHHNNIELFNSERQQAETEFRAIFREYLCELKGLLIQKSIEKGKSITTFITKVGTALLGSDLDADNFDSRRDYLLNTKIFRLPKTTLLELCKGDAIKLYSGTYFRNRPLGDVEPLRQCFLRFVYYEYANKEFFHLVHLWETVLQYYDQIKQKSGVMTYSDIAYYTYKYLYNDVYSLIDKNRFIIENIFYEFLAVRNQYLLIDEFQDTSLLQFMILAPMMRDLVSGNSVYSNTAVIVVGDEKQSIYSWRDGEKGLLGYMQTFLNTSVESLSVCYRSVPAIVDFVNKLFVDTHYKDLFIANSADAWVYDAHVTSARQGEVGSVCNYLNIATTENDPYTVFINDVVLPLLQSGNGGLGEIAILARRNNDLERIAQLLGEHDIPFIIETSHSIFENKVAKIIIWLMRYIQYRDIISLLKFLCSDVCLINGQRLKEIATSFVGDGPDLPTFNTPELATIHAIYNDYHSNNQIDALYNTPLTLCHQIIDRFNLTSIFHSDPEIKNLHFFISTITEFLDSPGDFPADLDGFIRFAEEKGERREYKQPPSAQNNAIQLITIHKSKGLGFDTVIVYQDCTHRKSNLSETLLLKYIIDSQSYDRLADLFLTINYQTVIKELFADEYRFIQQKEDVEEMNTLYVALTRAKTNLAVFWHYKEADMGADTLIGRVLKAVGDAPVRPEFPVGDAPVRPVTVNSTPYLPAGYIDTTNASLALSPIENAFANADLKKLYLHSKSNLIGNATHQYLSLIKYNRPDEHQLALAQTTQIYGQVLSIKEIAHIAEIAKSFIAQNPDLYSTTWDKVFNELSIFDKAGKLFRIDRLMVNTAERKILIIDYKTGRLADKDQIARYISIVSELPACQSGGYAVEGKYCSVGEW